MTKKTVELDNIVEMYNELEKENEELKEENEELKDRISSIDAELENGINSFYYEGADLYQAVLLNKNILNDTDLMYRVVQILAAYKKKEN